MTPTEAAINSLRAEAQRPNSIHAAEIALLLAQLDRYEQALREIAGGEYGDDAMRLAQEALRCESSS